MMKLPFLIPILLSVSLAFAHCGNCEKGKDGHACSKHKTELVGKMDKNGMSSDSLKCPKMQENKACDRVDCPKHKGMAADSCKMKDHCPKLNKQ